MQLERELEARPAWVQSKESVLKLDKKGTPLCTHLFFHSFNKNVLHADPLPGLFPWVLGIQVAKGSSHPPEEHL